jgi:indole-3-glycerol phosphate synthase
LLPNIPEGYVVVSESGLQDRPTIAQLEAHGVAAFLIGESLMREADMGAKLAALRGASERLADAAL